MLRKSTVLIAIFLTAAGCGGGGDSSSDGGPTTATGQFKDSNTAGLSYVSGDQSGVTGADGSFTYEIGKTVTFSVGGVTVGTASGKAVITPVDLVAEGSSSSVEVQNITRFLMMLDDDGNPSNGINISTSVQTMAENWSQVDFSTADLSSELTSIIADAASVDGGIHALPSANTAEAHLQSTLLCSYAGAYKGTYSSNTSVDNGTLGFMVDASSGNVTGVAYNIPFNEVIGLSGTTPISYDQDATFVSGIASTGTTFEGQFDSVDAVSGTWQDDNSGTFSGARIGGAKDAAYRFTGIYSGDDNGLISFDIDGSNSITGVSYSVSDGDQTLCEISGTVSGTELTATACDAAVAGTLNTSTGVLSGTWSVAANGETGTFSGSGCRLN